VLGIRLSEDAERRLARHAREAGRPKSVVARDWILDRLEREEVDEQIRRAAALHAELVTDAERRGAIAASDAFSRLLDAEDGGYDWGPEGPPPVQ
jgi:predicted transcriptional regulator